MAEGARLESAYTPTRCIEGSNPSLSASLHFLSKATARHAIEDRKRRLARRSWATGVSEGGHNNSLLGASSRQAFFGGAIRLRYNYGGTRGCRVVVHRTKTGRMEGSFVCPAWDLIYFNCIPLSGEMAEWLKAVASKAIVRSADRGFESLSLRQPSLPSKYGSQRG